MNPCGTKLLHYIYAYRHSSLTHDIYLIHRQQNYLCLHKGNKAYSLILCFDIYKSPIYDFNENNSSNSVPPKESEFDMIKLNAKINTGM